MIQDGQYKVRAPYTKKGKSGIGIFPVAVMNGVVSLIREDKEMERQDLLDPVQLVKLDEVGGPDFAYDPGVNLD
jgi:hypothetical protein